MHGGAWVELTRILGFDRTTSGSYATPRSEDHMVSNPNRSPQIVDELLVLECQRGDAQALDRLVERWDRRLHAHAFRLCGDVESASEVVQEAWLAIVRGIPKLKDPGRFRPWIYRIVTHKAADHVRQAQQQRQAETKLRDRAESGQLTLPWSP